MVDFKKHLNKTDIEKKINPLEIYDTIDRKSITGPLRPAQNYILAEWFKSHNSQKDLVIKLHTGEGKTLIGLLILQSKLNSKSGPCLYICPNIYLVQQVCEEAEKFGINYCTIQNNNEIPDEFLSGEKILIIHAQKIFNGKNIFGIGNNCIKVGCIILDDSHACIDIIKNSFTIKIIKDLNPSLYNSILCLFEDDLREQGEGSLLDIQNGSQETLLPIPFWSWNEKKTELLRILVAHNNDNQVKFTWPLIKDNIENSCAFVTGNKIDICPYYTNIKAFGTFSNADQRILMSATTQDDSFFIKGLNFDISAVKNPLMNIQQKWSGEKMILIPSLIDESCDRNLIINKFSVEQQRRFGIVVITSSTKKSELYGNLGANVTDKDSIYGDIINFKKGNLNKTLVINNRYDGIDLPDETCRILIIDSMPFFDNLIDRYEEQCRPNSEIINKQIAQKIEQGFGRGVRGEKDYCVILIIGSDIVKFVKSVNTNKYFSSQTKKQVNIGIEIAKMSQDEIREDERPYTIVVSLINQCLKRDEGWKEYYLSEMNRLNAEINDSKLYETMLIERDSEELFYQGDSEAAYTKIQNFIDSKSFDSYEKGWYLQVMSRYKYSISKVESNKLQKSAFKLNSELLKPKDGISYKKISYINENRNKRIKGWISNFNDYSEMSLHINATLENLHFGIEHNKFEEALKVTGEILGFVSQRPDKEIKKGADNLWCGVDNKYFMFECKSEVEDSRSEISKHEAGQMNNHCAWFESEYSDVFVKRILIIPTKILSYYADFTHDVEIMKKNHLDLLRQNIKSFIKEFSPYNLHEISDEKIQLILDAHNLDINSIQTLYSEKYIKR